MINAVMLGAIAGCGKLPIPVEAFEARDPRRRQGGRGQPARLPRRPRAARTEADRAPRAHRRQAPRKAAQRPRHAGSARSATTMPQAGAGHRDRRRAPARRASRTTITRGSISTGSRRCATSMRRCGGDGKLLRETARHLAVRMSFEDVIRVAQAKIDPARMRRIDAGAGRQARRAVSASPNFSSPASRKCARSCRRALARRIIAYSEQRGWLDRVHVGMDVKTTSVIGYLRFWLLAKLRPLRRFMHRYREEQAQIESWLAHVLRRGEAVARSRARNRRMRAADQGLRLDPQARHREFSDRSKTRLIRPALQGQIPVQDAHRRHRQRPHRGPCRSRRRVPRASASTSSMRGRPSASPRNSPAYARRHCKASGRPLRTVPARSPRKR